jgi:general secretion pathway protein L
MRVLRMPARKVLRRTLVLPLAAESNLRELLGFEMDRYTPFKADAVYYQHTILSRDRARGRLQVELAVVPRSEADPLLAAARRDGAEPLALDLGNALVELPAARRRRLFFFTVTSLVVVLAVAAAALPLWRKAEAAARLEAEVERLAGEPAAADQARKALAAFDAEARLLTDRRALRPSALEVLAELTRVLPERCSLNHVELSGTQLRVRGQAADAAALVSALEGSAFFRGAGFEGSVTREPGERMERFTLVATAQRSP